jgi:hypothetical protein
MKAPVLRAWGTGVPKDLTDPLLQTWQLAWGAQALRHNPFHPWDGNIFWPLRDSYAFSDHLYGYSPVGVLFGSGPHAAILRYQTLFLFAYALAGFGAYLLARQLGASRVASAVAGLAYAYAPWHLGQDGHLHVLSSGAVPLSLALLARGHGLGGHGDQRPPLRPGTALVGWLVAAWQVTLGFAVGLQLVYLLGSIVIGAGALLLIGRITGRRRSWAATPLLVADGVGLAVFLVVAALFAAPFLRVVDHHPEAKRTLADVERYSPPPRGFLSAPEASLVWRHATSGVRARLTKPDEMSVFPGLAITALAIAGAAAGSWSRRRRVALVAVAITGAVLACGTALGPGDFIYRTLFHHLPGWQSIRTPGRLMLLTSLALAMLGAAGVDVLRRQLSGRWRTAAAGALVVVVAVEGLGRLPTPEPPSPPPGLASAPKPVLLLPMGFTDEAPYVWFSIPGFFPLVNGYSGFIPSSYATLAADMTAFPDARTVDALQRLGVASVVLVRGAQPSVYERALDRPLEGLPVRRVDEGTSTVFTIAPRPQDTRPTGQ